VSESRVTFVSNLAIHQSLLAVGTVPCLGHRCQKHPSTNTATRSVEKKLPDVWSQIPEGDVVLVGDAVHHRVVVQRVSGSGAGGVSTSVTDVPSVTQGTTITPRPSKPSSTLRSSRAKRRCANTGGELSTRCHGFGFCCKVFPDDVEPACRLRGRGETAASS
jgi:hypothetical protein